MLRRSPDSVNLVQSYGDWKVYPRKIINNRKYFYVNIIQKKWLLTFLDMLRKKWSHTWLYTWFDALRHEDGEGTRHGWHVRLVWSREPSWLLWQSREFWLYSRQSQESSQSHHHPRAVPESYGAPSGNDASWLQTFWHRMVALHTCQWALSWHILHLPRETPQIDTFFISDKESLNKRCARHL